MNPIIVDFCPEKIDDVDLLVFVILDLIRSFTKQLGHNFTLQMREEMWEKVAPAWARTFMPASAIATGVEFIVTDDTLDSVINAILTFKSLPYNGDWYPVQVIE